MSTIRWKGAAPSVSQINTVTVGGTPALGQVYTVSMGVNSAKSVTYTATGADTNTTIATALTVLLVASTYPEFAEVTWTSANAIITGTARTAGYPFTCTSASSGTGTLVTAIATANGSPNDWGNALNWSTGAVPVAADDVYLENSAVGVWYGLAQSGVTLTSLNVATTFTGTIGLAETNRNGTPYPEYRVSYLAVGSTTVTIGYGDSFGLGSGRIKLDSGSVQTALTVRLLGSQVEQDVEALQWKGTHANNAVSLYAGTTAIAGYSGDSATVLTLNVGGSAQVRCGAGVTLGTGVLTAGALELNAGATTLKAVAGNLLVKGTGAITTLTADKAAIDYRSSGTVTTCTIGNGASLDFSQDSHARTFATTTILAGGSINDPSSSVTWTNGILFSRCDVPDCRVVFGQGRTVTPV